MNSKWHEAMIKRYGSEEAYKAVMRQNASKGGRTSVERGHLKKISFASDPERAREAGRKSRKGSA